MKKALAIILVLILLFSFGSVSYADSKAVFDHSVFAEHDTYSYDKFEDAWDYNVVYNYRYNEEKGDTAIISFIISNYLGNETIAFTFLAGSLNDNGGPSHNSESVIFLVDNERYTVKTDGDLILLGTNCRPLIEAIANAKEISIKVKLEDVDDVIIEGDLETFEPLISYCKEIVDSKVMDAIKSSTDIALDKMFPDAFSH